VAILHHLPHGVPRRFSILASALALALMVSAGARPARAQAVSDALAEVKIDKCRRETGRVVVSYHLQGALRPEDRKDLEGGGTIVFTHRIDLYRRRAFFADKWIGRRSVESSATLDTLTGQYTLSRWIDGAEERKTTEKPAEMEKWLNEVRNLPMDLPEDEVRGALEVRVTTKYRKTFLLFVWPYELPAKGSGECR
jgi:hypothetical protein